MYSAHINSREVLDVKILSHVSGQKVLDVEKIKHLPLKKKMYLTRISDQKVLDAEMVKQSFSSCKKSQKVDDTEIIPSEVTTSCTSRTIKLISKAWDVRCLLDQRPSITEQNLEIENLIV